MTILSPTSTIVALQSVNKGSTYGEASSSSSHHSFQESHRGGGSYGANRVKVLYSQAIIYFLCQRSITI